MSVCRAATVVLPLLALSATGCDDDDPVTRTGEIVIQLSGIREGSIDGGFVEEEKNVTTESGNPYGAFLASARDALGHDPSRIEVTSASITLGSDSRGVTTFEELFSGETHVFLRADVGGTDVTVNVARFAAPSGAGPVAGEVVADHEALAPLDAALLSAGFRVGVRGPTALTAADSFDARIDVTIGFAAYP